MKVFLSWSGKRSKFIAEALSNWLEQVLQAAEPWISTGIEKGRRFSDEISDKLKESKVAIICLTNDNLDSKWIHFEAGAIAKTDDAHVCTLLYEIKPSDVEQPLSQFQATKFEKNDILNLAKTINSKIGNSGGKSLKEKNLESVFETFWPQLEDKLKKIPLASKTAPGSSRTDRELLEESLQILRSFKNKSNDTSIGESDKNEIVDYWIERFAIKKQIKHTSIDLKDYVEDIVKFMWPFPEFKIHFNNTDDLKIKVRDRVNDLLPF